MLATVDTLRRPGAVEMAHDHARVLAPLGALESEADRRRLLVDLLEDVLLPLGTAVVAAGPGPRLGAGRLRIIDGESTVEVPVASGTVQSVPLPAGRRATLELETRDGSWLGTRSRRVALDVAGGVGGVLVDTRDVPLRLPERNDQRRELLDAWHRIVWPEDEA
jgi:hypothetical protein